LDRRMSAALDYLRVGRAQTAAVEGAGFPLAAWIGGAPLWALPLFALLGILAHLGGFGENGISDLAYDRQDPSKLEHPLVSGRLSFSSGLAFVYGCQAAGVALFIALEFASPAPKSLLLLPVLAFLGYILLGHVYNFLGKVWKPGAVLEISGAFALAFLACGSLWTGGADTTVWLVTAYAFVFVGYQIGLAGEIKELGQMNESNLLRRLGSRVGPGLLGAASPSLAGVVAGGATVIGNRAPFLLTGRGTWWLAHFLTIAKVGTLTAIAYLVGGEVWARVVFFGSFVSLGIYEVVLLSPGPFDRPRRLKVMGLGEAGSYLLLVLALAPSLWMWLLPAFLLLPVAWFAILNRVLWSRTGSVWAPGV